MDSTDGMDSKRLKRSLFYAERGVGGMWVDAVWSAAVTDDATGEVLAMATNPEDGGRWAMVGVRLNPGMLGTLRSLAGVTGPLPADEARAELAYWRESVEFAVGMLARGRTAGQDWRQAARNAESYLRQLLGGADGADGADRGCYDCRTNGERLATIERRQEEDAETFGQHARRLAELEERLDALQKTSNRLVLFAGSDREVKELSTSLAAMKYTVDALQRLAKRDHGPEAGL